MNDFLLRQFAIIRRLVGDYRNGKLPLDSLIQEIEGISGLLNIESWGNELFPIVLDLEQINAMSINTKTELTAQDEVDVENLLIELEGLINRFQREE